MKKCMVVLAVLLLYAVQSIAPALALTVEEFVQRYNENCGESFHLRMDWFSPDEERNIWFLLASTRDGDSVSVQYDPQSAENPEQCLIKKIFVMHKPRTSVGRFVARADLALKAAYPDMDPEARARIIIGAMEHAEILFGESPADAIAYNVDEIGQFVYQETIERDVLLIPVENE